MEKKYIVLSLPKSCINPSNKRTRRQMRYAEYQRKNLEKHLFTSLSSCSDAAPRTMSDQHCQMNIITIGTDLMACLASIYWSIFPTEMLTLCGWWFNAFCSGLSFLRMFYSAEYRLSQNLYSVHSWWLRFSFCQSLCIRNSFQKSVRKRFYIIFLLF